MKLVNQIEEFIDKLSNEWTLREIEIKMTPKYGDKLTIKKEIHQNG